MASGAPHRPGVKRRVLTRQETLQRIRDECTDRISKDREALRSNLRDSLKGSLEGAIRDTINTAWAEDYAAINEEDIDKLVQEFLNERDLIFFHEDEAMQDDPDEWNVGMVKCPLCPSGWLLEPYPGIVACDACAELRLSIGIQDLASALDATIRAHAAFCSSSRFSFRPTPDGLLFNCQACGQSTQVVP